PPSPRRPRRAPARGARGSPGGLPGKPRDPAACGSRARAARTSVGSDVDSHTAQAVTPTMAPRGALVIGAYLLELRAVPVLPVPLGAHDLRRRVAASGGLPRSGFLVRPGPGA